MKKFYENKIFIIVSLFLIFGAVAVVASTIGDSGYSGIQVDNYFTGSGKQGITQDISFIDNDGNNRSLSFEDGLLVNYSLVEPNVFDGLVSYYKLDEQNGSGTIVDAFGDNDGLGNALDNASGKIGTSYNYTNDTSEISFGANPFEFEGGESWSFSAWVRAYLPVDNTDRNLFSKIESSPNYEGYSFYYRNRVDSKKFGFDARGSSGYYSAFWDYNWTDNNWHFVTLTFNGTDNAKVYIDGNEIEKSSSSGSMLGSISNSSAFIGNRDGLDTAWRGLIDEVGIWNRTLNAAEIQTLYNNGEGLTYS